MAKKTKVKDYMIYFIPTKDGVLVDTDIFQHRAVLGNKIWSLLRLMTGVGNQRDVQEFERIVDDNYLARKQFDVIRGKLFDDVAKRDGQLCKQCRTTHDLTLDHIIQLSRGGPNELGNMQILCRKHNSQKGAR